MGRQHDSGMGETAGRGTMHMDETRDEYKLSKVRATDSDEIVSEWRDEA